MKDAALDGNSHHYKVSERKAHYQKLSPLLTEELQQLSLQLHPGAFEVITFPENLGTLSGIIDMFNLPSELISFCVKNEEVAKKMDPELSKELFGGENIKEKENSRLSQLLFGKTLGGLSSLELNLYDESPLEWNEESSLNKADVDFLERSAPNLRSLVFKDFFFKKSFIQALVTSTLITKLETLKFDTCEFESNNSCFALFFRNGQFSSLKCLQLPYFEERDPLFYLALQELRANHSLEKLETLIIVEHRLHIDTARALLFTIARNPSLKNLKTIKGLEISEGLIFPKELGERFRSMPNFDFSCIEHLFEK